MVELILKFKEPNGGTDREVSVSESKFTIGRHSECHVTIADTRLSREHLMVERFGDFFVITDQGSSNGTKLNDEPVEEPKAIKHGDRLELGGFEIEILIVGGDDSEDKPPAPELAVGSASVPAASTGAATATDTGIPRSLFIIAPLLGIFVLAGLGIIVYSTSGNKQIDNSNFVYSIDPGDTPKPRKTPEPGSSPTNSGGTDISTSGTNTADPGNTGIVVPTPANLNDAGKTEANAAAFLRKAAANDPKAFVTGAQAQIINAKVKTLAASPAIADNISSARRNATAIKALATSKNLKPQFLAAAALAKLGTSRGDVLTTAQSMADTLDKLAVQVGNELGDDCLLMIAAYDQGDPMKMRNMLQDLATKSTESSRTIRSIWFLQRQGKITQSEYDFALRFLAVGTIAQNPRDFGVNTDGLNF